MNIRNRIVDHVTVRAGDLVPHPLNFRKHPDAQRQALTASYAEVGFARSLLGYQLPDGRIQLIDGHLRRDFDPDMDVTVELLDVTEEEARKLLLTIDPLAALAETDAQIAAQLAATVQADSKLLNDFWKSLGGKAPPPAEAPPCTTTFLVLIECTDEAQQVELLRRFHEEGLKCKALLS